MTAKTRLSATSEHKSWQFNNSTHYTVLQLVIEANTKEWQDVKFKLKDGFYLWSNWSPFGGGDGLSIWGEFVETIHHTLDSHNNLKEIKS